MEHQVDSGVELGIGLAWGLGVWKGYGRVMLQVWVSYTMTYGASHMGVVIWG